MTPALDALKARLRKQESASLREHLPTEFTGIAESFGLTLFETELLLLACAAEFDSSFIHLYEELGYPAGPTLSLALACLDEPDWRAILPTAALRHWQLIELQPGAVLTSRPLHVEERILHALAGEVAFDSRLAIISEQIYDKNGTENVALEQHLRNSAAAGNWHTVHLTAPDVSSARAVAAGACAKFQMPLFAIRASDIPVSATERDLLSRLWQREVILQSCALLIDTHNLEPAELRRIVLPFVDSLHGIVFTVGPELPPGTRRGTLTLPITKPSSKEQHALWTAALGSKAAQLNGKLETLVGHFDLSSASIRELAFTTDAATLWNACRQRSRATLEGLARRIPNRATWDDLVLPREQSEILREIATQAKARYQVYEQWGFRERSARGCGITALFHGPSGTGKTLAAEVLATELDLDLFHVDLSSVISKYIGETEKQLKRIFDAGEESGAVLLFDEADALFGKRSEVKDSHDRYANLEVSYLLQRMEAYSGLAILTTNMKSSIDQAFLRRLRFIVAFSFPGPEERERIWARAFPPQTPTSGLDNQQLARLHVTGGSIRNIALHAAFLAAGQNQPVKMEHLLASTRSEYAKLEKHVTESETGGWVS